MLNYHNYETFIHIAEENFGLIIIRNESLKNYTTCKIGGQAELLVKVNSCIELEEILTLAHKNNIKVTVLGCGSNTLVSDDGLRGLVIINCAKKIQILDLNVSDSNTLAQYEPGDIQGWIDYTKSSNLFDSFIKQKYKHLILFDSGVKLSIGVSKTVAQGYTGLEWFVGISSSIGGSIINDIQYNDKYLTENIVAIKILSFDFGGKSQIQIIDKNELKLKIQNSNIFVLQVLFALVYMGYNNTKGVTKSYKKHKKIQPNYSTDCIFKSISKHDAARLGIENTNAGIIIKKHLGIAGKKIGGIHISTHHSNYFINDGTGTAQEVVRLIKEVQDICLKKLGLKLETKINFLGFDK
jgi:UDP-N-acetylmuramate dehydrogenase